MKISHRIQPLSSPSPSSNRTFTLARVRIPTCVRRVTRLSVFQTLFLSEVAADTRRPAMRRVTPRKSARTLDSTRSTRSTRGKKKRGNHRSVDRGETEKPSIARSRDREDREDHSSLGKKYRVSSFTIWYVRVTTRVFSIGVDSSDPSIVVRCHGTVRLIRFVHSSARPSVRVECRR